MKVIKMITMLAASVTLSSGVAATPYTGELAGAASSGPGTLTGSVPLAIIASEEVVNALQILQFGDGHICVGNRSLACMPRLSSAELRSMIYKSVPGLTSFIGDGNPYANLREVLQADAGITQGDGVMGTANHDINNNNFNMGYSSDSVDGIKQFLGAYTVIDLFNCGPNSSLPAPVDCSGDASAVISCVEATTNRARFAIVPASQLGDSNAANLGYIKLDGQAPTLANWAEGDYPLGQNIIGTPTAGFTQHVTSFGVVGAESLTSSTLRHASSSSYVDACAPLRSGPDIVQ